MVIVEVKGGIKQGRVQHMGGMKSLSQILMCPAKCTESRRKGLRTFLESEMFNAEKKGEENGWAREGKRDQ